MKKKYVTPSEVFMDMELEHHLLSGSQVMSDGYVDDITYGGVTDGSVTPEAKPYNVWDADWSK